jgi:hypothetical protein
MMEIMMMVVMMAMAGTVWFAGTNEKKTNKHLASKPFVKCLAFFKHGFV